MNMPKAYFTRPKDGFHRMAWYAVDDARRRRAIYLCNEAKA